SPGPGRRFSARTWRSSAELTGERYTCRFVFLCTAEKNTKQHVSLVKHNTEHNVKHTQHS
ncbi:unnamed protein product, partial [Staurois parvus]